MSLTGVDAISAMVTPVVLITTGCLLSNGFLAVYSSINDRMREMTRERLDICAGPRGELFDAASVSAVGQERLTEIDHQLPMLLRRHHLMRQAVLLIYAAIAVLVLSVIAIGVAETQDSRAFSSASLALVLAGTVVMLAGIVVAGRSLVKSSDAITYAVERTRSPGLRPGPLAVA